MKTDIIDIVRLLFRKDKKPFLQLHDILGFYPHNIKLYQLALKHKSVVHHEREERRSRGDKKPLDFNASLNNERLEYLGDAILGAIVADILYRHYGTKQEGFLTSMRSKIVRRSSLNKLAVDIGLDKLILHSHNTGNAHNSYMNGNAFEAFFGAIYLDRGYSYCYRFMEERIFRHYINVEKLTREDENHKSTLIEWCQKYQYKFQFVNHEKRENNVPKFISEVSIEGLLCGKGEGYSKKESDQAAADEALRLIKRDKTLRDKLNNIIADRKRRAKQQSDHDKAMAAIKGRKTVILDLDGTLTDTLQDLANSTNHALRQCGYPERTLAEVKSFVGNGVGTLIRRAVPKGTSEEDTASCLDAFRTHYMQHCRDNTRLYDGIAELLHHLKGSGYRMAIVSNKLQSGVTEIYNQWFSDTIEVAIGETPDTERKPAPDMVVKALQAMGADPSDAIYIGDSEVDVQTARNAALPCISVLWGFRSRNQLAEAGATLFAERPEEILSLLTQK